MDRINLRWCEKMQIYPPMATCLSEMESLPRDGYRFCWRWCTRLISTRNKWFFRVICQEFDVSMRTECKYASLQFVCLFQYVAQRKPLLVNPSSKGAQSDLAASEVFTNKFTVSRIWSVSHLLYFNLRWKVDWSLTCFSLCATILCQAIRSAPKTMVSWYRN